MRNRRFIAWLATVLGAMALQGCWPFHSNSPTPQQQMLNAMQAGQGAQANQIWLGMSPEDRLKFQQGRGMQAAPSPDEAQQQILQHAADDMTNGTMSDGTTIERVKPDPNGGLENLDKVVPRNSPPPQTDFPPNSFQ